MKYNITPILEKIKELTEIGKLRWGVSIEKKYTCSPFDNLEITLWGSADLGRVSLQITEKYKDTDFPFHHQKTYYFYSHSDFSLSLGIQVLHIIKVSIGCHEHPRLEFAFERLLEMGENAPTF